jgi:hypothetical protein
VTILCILSMSLVGCGGGSTSVPRGISVSISPSSVNVATSQSRLFNATVNNDDSGKGVTWNLTGTGCSGVECGSLTAATATSVIYTAPDTLPVPAGVALTATANADKSRTAAANVSLFEGGAISIAISPSSPTVDLGATVQLIASVSNDPNNGGVIGVLKHQAILAVFLDAENSPRSRRTVASQQHTLLRVQLLAPLR